MLTEIEFLDSLLSGLIESKAISTHGHLKHAPSARNRPRTQLHTYQALANYDDWKSAKKYQASVAKSKLDELKSQFRAELLNAVKGFKDKRYTGEGMKSISKGAFDKAYAEAYALGLRAAGLTQLEIGGTLTMDQHDKDWMKSSLSHERRYWNEFVTSVITGSIDAAWRRFTVEQRIEFYVRTLDHVYETARVVGHPHHSIMYWKLNPAEHCQSCLFLATASPFTRETLPCTPRSGQTQCLANCKCELRIVTTASTEQWDQVRHQNNRNLLVTKLKALKGRS